MGGKTIKKLRYFFLVITLLAAWAVSAVAAVPAISTVAAASAASPVSAAWAVAPVWSATMRIAISQAYADTKPLSLQPFVDQATPGATLDIPPGLYTGPVIIDKPLALRGNGQVEIRHAGTGPAIAILADQVRLSGIKITVDGATAKDSSLYVASSDNILQDLLIHTQGIGIQLHEAHRNMVENIQIVGSANLPQNSSQPGRSSFLKKGNGIDLWGSHDNTIRFSTISGVQDGIYIESSESNLLEKNDVANSRYGYHLMFTKNTSLFANKGAGNVVGAMIMQTEGTRVIGNHFTKQYENVNSQGILLYNVKKAMVKGNHVRENRIGIRVEQATDNQIINNTVAHNFVGLQLISSESNLFRHNQFVSNVIQAQNLQSGTNDIRENYWDDAQVLDLNGDGNSDLPYRINPFFLTMAEAAPPFQLFFQSPGMMFLEKLAGNSDYNLVSDHSPLAGPVFSALPAEGVRDAATGLASAMMFMFSIFIIYKMGVSRK